MPTENQSPIECWSTNEEDFNSLSLDELIGSNEHLKVGDTVWKGEAVHPDPTSYIDAGDVIELIGGRAYDDCGEYAEDFPDVSGEAKAELDELLAGWIRKHCSTTSFYKVSNVVEYTLTAEDLAGAEQG
ncbi:hypothetical protein [Azotobacter salinestris]|uniref:hypothetical protein n=1 Tax=Azotobacter salinestris TaxID=69964 RepID=UPI0032DEDB7D